MIHRFRLPLGGKIFLICFGLGVAIALGGSIVIFNGASHSLREEVRSRLAAEAAVSALQIDPSLHESIRSTSDESSAAYRQIKQTLRRIKSSEPAIRYIYTMRKTAKPNVWQFVVDAEENPDDMSHVGDEFDVSPYPEMRRAFHKPSSDKEPSHDKWGTWLSAYAPIRDSSGRAIAIVGMDMSLAQLQMEQTSLRSAMIRNVIVVVLLCVLAGLVFTKMLLKPISALNDAVKRVCAGDLGFQISMRSSDELGELVRSFDQMIVSLTERSTRDYLTGLFNFMYMREALQLEIEQARRQQRELCLIIFDLDRFKGVNDTLGHPIGNSILHQLGDILRDNLRAGDIAARYGGDEFVLILPDTSEDAGRDVAERVRDAVERYEFSTVTVEQMLSQDLVPEDHPTVHITCTMGLACFPKHHTVRDGLLMAADIALYRAKNVARNSVYVYDESVNLESQVDPQDLYSVLYDASSSAIQSLAAAVDAKDRYTCGHSERVARYASSIAVAMGMDQEFQDAVHIAGLLHDLGKIGIPDAILNKTERLTDEEREVIERHPTVGGNILSRSQHLAHVLPGVLYHHERFDGEGYPEGLYGDSIPLIARVLAVADSFDAMTSDRPYRNAMSPDTALIELRANAGGQFDPEVVDAFISTMRWYERKAA